MGDTITRAQSEAETATLPQQSQAIVKIAPEGDWRQRLTAARDARAIANRKRRRSQRARYLATELAPVAAITFWLGALFVLSAYAPRMIGLWMVGSVLIALVSHARQARAGRRFSAEARVHPHTTTSELDAATLVGELTAFEATANTIASSHRSAPRRTGAHAFAFAARGNRAKAEELLAHNPAVTNDPRDPLYRALAQLVLAAIADDTAAIQRVAPVAEQLATTAPTCVQRLVHALSSPSAAPYRSATTSSPTANDDFHGWLAQFVPSVAEKLGPRASHEHQPWFRAPSASSVESLPDAQPLRVRLQSNDAFLLYATAAAFAAAVVAPTTTHPAARREFGVLVLASVSAVVATAVVLDSLRQRAARTIATTPLLSPVARWTELLATLAPNARNRLFAMARLACRHLLAGDNASALALARRIAAESESDDADVELYQCTSLWIAGLTRDERATEALLAAIEQHASIAAKRVARRFDARLALAVAHNDQARVERLVVDAWEAAPPWSVAAWVAQRVARTEDGDPYGEAVEQWLASMGLMTVLIERAPWLAREEPLDRGAPGARRD